MEEYNKLIKVKTRDISVAKPFLEFLKLVAEKNSNPTKINYKYLGRGRFLITIKNNTVGIDTLLQELILNKGLHYYICSIAINKHREIANSVVTQIFQDLLEGRFQNTYSHFLRRHLSGKPIDEKYLPGDFKNSFGHQFEVLFRKWNCGSVDDWNFIKDLDSLLTQFLLTKIDHISGEHSPKFTVLIDHAYRKGIGMVQDLKGVFNNIHKARTDGLHRLKADCSKEKISEFASWIYNYFQFLDDFDESQNIQTQRLHGKLYKRIKYGEENFKSTTNEWVWEEISKQPCHDCAAFKGQYHCIGCDVEQCPRCSTQFLSCSCKLIKDYNKEVLQNNLENKYI